ncbi:cache domain-containing protein [Actibacterium lipolyticum]|uniref:histidine kinase n=1 Tax=Actibacterium lipolyticum TaxID=1524263 RepID=A0A238KHJ1_9RHOB|nr:cache domain-containing protein [Actibacterium lipolyticum]SMX42329.1 Signal transduction histidine-protein kinase/phosphatase DegS [Actibacterium lipolyticum]
MAWLAQQIKTRFTLSYAQKLFLLATVPLLLAVAAISYLVINQSRQMAQREIAALETQLIEAKKAELKNYLALARTSFSAVYGNALPDDEAAKEKVAQVLAAMLYGQDGYFFVYDYNGTNLVSPRQTEFINGNWAGLSDTNGIPVVDELIQLARTGGGYHSYMWRKPSTGEEARMVSYVIGLQDWKWAVGTGIFIDDVLNTVAAARAKTEARVARTFWWIGGITLAAVLLVFLSGLGINIRERRLADAKLKQLTQRIFDTQEEERGRVARELHDSISQILVGARYALELAKRRLTAGDARAEESVEKGITTLNGAIQEVRRISRDLRPGVLDDLGLGPALKALTEDFQHRTGMETEFETVVFRNRLDKDAKIALYRIAQEALTNIERHAEATQVTLKLFGHKGGGTLRISDNGVGIEQPRGRQTASGLGLRNMQERIEQLNGNLRILSSKSGTVIEAQVPLSHMLPPEGSRKASA